VTGGVVPQRGKAGQLARVQRASRQTTGNRHAIDKTAFPVVPAVYALVWSKVTDRRLGLEQRNARSPCKMTVSVLARVATLCQPPAESFDRMLSRRSR